MRKYVVTAALAVCLAAPAGASVGVGWELDAGDQVERVANHRAHGFSFVASCRCIARTKFTCDHAGFRGACTIDGLRR